ncbi:peptidoglycan-binding protein [Streptomyces sp. CC219B]|uniref:peptidoglycan-binding protein n=1 Tax=Streptomyces sp. CC219B TaxID=3044574 RepID=UPI0024A9DB48|nr:peptidoglycan-binding protein [Streptomyces sp. CC219B]
METPVFEEFDPASDCDCPGCVHRYRAPSPSAAGRAGGGPAHRTVIVAAAAAALGAAPAVPALAAPQAPGRPSVPAGEEPETPQGSKAPLHGPSGTAAEPAEQPGTTRAEIIKRAKTWVEAKVPYSMTRYWSDGYRQDCSGFVSMAWNLPGNEWTGSLGRHGIRIPKEELQPGDMLLFHNPADPQKGSHVTIFGGWTDYTHTYYIAYEATRPYARKQATPYAYWSHSGQYVAYRYKGLAGGGAGGTGGTAGSLPDTAEPDADAYPGRGRFGPGANNQYVTRLGRMLVERGAGRYYSVGPGPRWSDADRRATQAFQQAQGWRGRDADGLPGPQTWALLVTGGGKDIRAGAAGPPAPSPAKPAPPQAKPEPSPAKPEPSPAKPAPSAKPAFPGRAQFRPGANNAHVTLLGKQLVKKGFGKYYTTGPGPRWGEADRRNVEAFQRAQGWRGGAADGYPGPETWRRLFA